MSRLDIRSIRRRQILDAAERLAAQKGWTETTIADICREADISTGVVTRYFKSKDEIVFAALEDVINDVTEQVQPLLTTNDLPVSESVPRLFQLISEMATTRRDLPLLLLHFVAAAVSHKDISLRLHEFFLHIRQMHVVYIERAMKEKQAPLDKEPLVLVNLIHSMALGVILNKVLLGGDLPIEQLALESANMLLKYFEV